MDPAIFVAIAAALLAMCFAALGSALREMSRSRLGELLDRRYTADDIEAFVQRLPSVLLTVAALRAACTLVLVLSVFHVVESSVGDAAPFAAYAIAFACAAVAVGVFVVAIPFSWGRYHREGLIALAMPLLRLSNRPPLSVVPWALHAFDPIVRRISGHDLHQDDEDVSDELMSVVEDSAYAEHVDDSQKQMLEAVFDLPNTDAADLMTPRTDVKGINVDTPLDELIPQIIAIGHSRIPAYEESLDRLLGILYVKDLLPHLREGLGNDFDLRGILREPLLVPESKKAAELIADFKQQKLQIAIVLDEYGGTAGLITVEDVLEELVGELQDEYENEPEPESITAIDDATHDVDARTHIDDLNDALNLDLPDDEDYDTLGGFVFARLGHIPRMGEAFEHDDVTFTVTQAERTRVVQVRVTRPVPTATDRNDPTPG